MRDFIFKIFHIELIRGRWSRLNFGWLNRQNKEEKMQKKIVIFALSLILIIMFSSTIMAQSLKVGFVYNGSVGDAGWTYSHELGRQHLEATFPEIETTYIESVPEGSESIQILESLARRDFDLIFTTSFGYMNQTLEMANKYPDVIFEHCSGYKTADNMGNYFGRMYQARYLTGIVAGHMTESNQVGFVAAHPIPEVIRGINSFTLGVLKANPEAEVNVIWTNSWYDPAGEKEAALSLIDLGADVIAQHQNTPGPQQAAEERGVYSIGYNLDMSEFAPNAHLTSPIWKWGMIYEEIVRDVMNDSWEPEPIWYGLEIGAVDIAPFGPMVPDEVRTEVAEAREAIVSGDFKVFEGPIYDQNGNLIVSENEAMSDDDIWQMNIFVEGVKGELPE